jgi:flagellin-like protein
MRVNRAVSPVISVILMVAIVVILVATASVFIFDSSGGLNEPAPFVADTTGEFEPEADGYPTNQIVQITHRGGDSVAVEKVEIIVRASGPSLDTEARLVDLPATERYITDNIQGDSGLISSDSARVPMKIITDDGPNVWSAGDTIQFRINVGEADFRDSAQGDPNEAEELEVIIIHTPSNAIISENTFTP